MRLHLGFSCDPSEVYLRAQTRRGFSLIELILSIAIIGTSLILVVGIFTILFAGSQKATDITTGSAIADGLLTQQIYQICSVDQVRTNFFRASYATPTLYRGGTYSLNNTMYFYKIYCQDATLSATLHDPDTDVAGGQTALKRFDVLIWWNDASAASQTQANNLQMQQQSRGVGLQEVHQMRLVWPTTGDAGQ